MKITKGTIEYTVSEHLNFWCISYSAGKLAVDFKIPKDERKTFEELKQRVLTSDEFGG